MLLSSEAGWQQTVLYYSSWMKTGRNLISLLTLMLGSKDPIMVCHKRSKTTEKAFMFNVHQSCFNHNSNTFVSIHKKMIENNLLHCVYTSFSGLPPSLLAQC